MLWLFVNKRVLIHHSHEQPTDEGLSSEETLDTRKSVHFYCIERIQPNVDQAFCPTEVAVNPRFRLIAIGTIKGDVYVYHLNDELQLSLSHKLDCAAVMATKSNR